MTLKTKTILELKLNVVFWQKILLKEIPVTKIYFPYERNRKLYANLFEKFWIGIL